MATKKRTSPCGVDRENDDSLRGAANFYSRRTGARLVQVAHASSFGAGQGWLVVNERHKRPLQTARKHRTQSAAMRAGRALATKIACPRKRRR